MLFFSKQMMKFIAILSVLTLMLGCLTGCGIKEATEEAPGNEVPAETSIAEQQPTETMQPEEDDGTNFVYIKSYYDFDIICNTQTRVMYSLSDGHHNRGTLTPLLYQNGDPMIYSGDLSLLDPVR